MPTKGQIYYAENHEKRLAYQAKYNADNSAPYIIYQRQYYQRNKEKLSEKARLRYQNRHKIDWKKVYEVAASKSRK